MFTRKKHFSSQTRTLSTGTIKLYEFVITFTNKHYVIIPIKLNILYTEYKRGGYSPMTIKPVNSGMLLKMKMYLKTHIH